MRNKSNLVPPAPPKQIILGAEERRLYLATVSMWRIFDMVLEALLEMGAMFRAWCCWQAWEAA